MAKPIKKTPSLKGENANKFIAEMLKTQNRKINKKEEELLKLLH